jgi:U3 small nucleolar RNA-associated protein 5
LLAADLSNVAATIALPSRTPAPTAVAILPTSTKESLHLVVASSSAAVLHVTPTGTEVDAVSAPLPVSTSTVTALYPLPAVKGDGSASFIVVSEDDRTVAQYTIPKSGADPRLSYRYTSPTLSSAHSVSSSPSHLSVMHTSGQVSLFPLPAASSLDLSRPQSNGKPHAVNLIEGKADKPARLCRACLAVPASSGGKLSLVAGRMLGGGRIKWTSIELDATDVSEGGETKVKCDAQDLVSAASGKEGKLQRYVAPTTVGEAIDADDSDAEDGGKKNAELPEDVDMADASLGERLLALSSGANANGDAGADASHPVSRKKVALPTIDGPVTAGSLTRLLVQALHTSDPALLSLCLNQRDPALIRNTIRKLPTQLSLPLLKACVERLGQGKRTNSRGGTRGVAQNEQQGRGTVEWVKGVLVERGAVLMTMPSLPAHLGALSRLLDQRLQLYSPLLQLSGRLDLALAQIAMRKVGLEAQRCGQKKTSGERYVEGESESESDEDEDEDVEVEVDHDDLDVEDINMLNGGSESEDEEDEDSDEDDEDEESDEDDPLESDEDGFDLEAEESDEEDEESDED